MAKIKFKHSGFAAPILIHSTSDETASYIAKLATCFIATSAVKVNLTELSSVLSIDSQNLFSAGTCRMILGDYIEIENGSWHARSALKDKPSHWLSISQFISIAINLSIVEQQGSNVFCNFKDFNDHWDCPDAIEPLWKGDAPDYVCWKLDDPIEFTVLECKGTTRSDTLRPTRLAKHKTQTLNHRAQFPVSRNILAYSHLCHGEPVVAQWFNNRKVHAHGWGEDERRIGLLIAYAQFVNQATNIRLNSVAKLLKIIVKSKIKETRLTQNELAEVVALKDELQQSIFLVTDPQDQTEVMSGFASSPMLINVINASMLNWFAEPDAAVEAVKLLISNHALCNPFAAQFLNSNPEAKEAKIYLTGIGFFYKGR